MNQSAPHRHAEEYYTSAEAAKNRRCSERKLEHERQVGNGPPYLKIRGQVLYPVSDHHNWLRAHLVTSTAEADALGAADKAAAQSFEEERDKRNEAAIRKLYYALNLFDKDMAVLKLLPDDIVKEAKELMTKLEKQL